MQTAASAFDSGLIAVTRVLPSDLITPVGALLRLREAGTWPFLLESADGGEQFGRFSILGVDPVAQIIAHSPGDAEWVQGGHRQRASLLSLLRTFSMGRCDPVAGLPFSGGLVGMIGFDFVRELERFAPRSSLASPVGWLGEYRDIVVFDHLRQTVQIVVRTVDAEAPLAEQRLNEMTRVITGPPKISEHRRFESGPRASNLSPDDFCDRVITLKDHIRKGDIFQAVLSCGFSRECRGDPLLLYRALRRVNPSPYMFYYETPVGTMIGASPELLVGVSRQVARVLPIAGTRPRGGDELEDRQKERELLADPKERAEHMMLVDLARNDLGRVADYGTVHVEEQAAVHRFSNVMHLVSHVAGRLRAGCTAVDALAASFPAGTVSGAPKIRALELIYELEPTPRGFYAGGAGFLGYDGDCEFCITLRTAVAQNGIVSYQAGAGIVADSVPENELSEIEHKAAAMERAIRLAEEWS